MRLEPAPAHLVETRNAYHQLAFFAVSPARYRAVGRMGLESTRGGFGTPEFDGQLARVDEGLLVHEQGGNVATQAITTIRHAAEFFGGEYHTDWFADFHDPLAPADPDTPLAVDPLAARFLADWFEFAFDILEELRTHGVDGDDVSEVQLWPEHFDPATELGEYEKGQRASFGASPGDEAHDEPYLYVAAWNEVDRSNPYWNNMTFNGASLSYADLLEAEDSRQRALDFLHEGYGVLHSG